MEFILIISLIVLFWGLVFVTVYQKRNFLFKRIAREFGLELHIIHYPFLKLVQWGDRLELRNVSGIIHGRRIVLWDEIKSRSILAPWWYRDLLFQLAQIRVTFLSIDGQVRDLSGGPSTSLTGFAGLRRMRRQLQSIE
jgi:hypothetical protein